MYPSTSFASYTPPPINCSLYPSPLTSAEQPETPPAMWPHATPHLPDEMTVCSAVPARFAERCCEVFGGNVSLVCGWHMCLADVTWTMWNACMRLADDADNSSNWGWGAECDALNSGARRPAGLGQGVVLGLLGAVAVCVVVG